MKKMTVKKFTEEIKASMEVNMKTKMAADRLKRYGELVYSNICRQFNESEEEDAVDFFVRYADEI